MQTLSLTPDAAGIAHAARLLRAGQTVAFPTETVYGLGADATNGRAVAAIYEAKGRPSFNPLIVHVADAAAAQNLVEWSDAAQILADAFWPGPLTLVLPMLRRTEIASLVSAGLPSLAVRVPAHPLAQDLLRAAERPLAAPSANPSGRISATQGRHVAAGLNGRIGAILDGGTCAVGLESSIVGLTEAPKLLRPGGVSHEALEATLGQPVALYSGGDVLTAPGQMASHYAPRAHVRLEATEAAPGELLIGFGDISGALTLSASGDLQEAAAALFSVLHQADEDGRAIAVAPIPSHGLGAAINDRLRRAAAPRD
ncbi:L-threonylcarbamoyladenylate synthase [Roseobacteraceae bacterium S113]